ncbi:MAG: hypothetical protein FD174_2899 [Geobacteraceae bacterium]|nr:MAG: hypothetical protein FD174_2899 [Geobacteraceae bacterium]
MKKIKFIFFAAIFGLITGCATTAGTTGNQVLSAEPEGDGVIRQKIQFKDLPAEMQDVISHGG